MKITKSKLKQIIKEELLEVMVDTDNDGIDDKRELAVVDKDPLDEILTQLFNLRNQYKTSEQYEVAGYIDEAIDKLERAASSVPRGMNEMLGGGNYPGARGPSTAHMTVGEIENIVAAAGIQGLMYGHAVELMDALDRSNVDKREFEGMLRNLPHHTKTTGRPYSALSWIYQQIG
jgi:hypothetical protein